jgi:hypothetical protein
MVTFVERGAVCEQRTHVLTGAASSPIPVHMTVDVLQGMERHARRAKDLVSDVGDQVYRKIWASWCEGFDADCAGVLIPGSSFSNVFFYTVLSDLTQTACMSLGCHHIIQEKIYKFSSQKKENT